MACRSGPANESHVDAGRLAWRSDTASDSVYLTLYGMSSSTGRLHEESYHDVKLRRAGHEACAVHGACHVTPSELCGAVTSPNLVSF